MKRFLQLFLKCMETWTPSFSLENDAIDATRRVMVGKSPEDNPPLDLVAWEGRILEQGSMAGFLIVAPIL